MRPSPSKALILHAPHQRENALKSSFEEIIQSHIAKGFAINSKLHALTKTNMKVVVLRKDRLLRRAEGRLVNIVATGNKTGNGIPRYDIRIANLKQCKYEPEKLNRNGVNIV
jgi:hypothetical protein